MSYCGIIPLVAQSPGFLVHVSIQLKGGVLMLLISYLKHLKKLPSCQFRTIVLSVQAWACSIETISAPHSSSQRMDLVGPTLDLAVTSTGDMFSDE